MLQLDNGTTASYGYDAFERRVQAVTQALGSMEYLYDAAGRRRSTWNAGNYGTEARIYWDYGLLAHRGWGNQTFFHHPNYLGTDRMRTNYQGQAIGTEKSGPFGENFSEQANNNIGDTGQDTTQYTGQEHGPEQMCRAVLRKRCTYNLHYCNGAGR